MGNRGKNREKERWAIVGAETGQEFLHGTGLNESLFEQYLMRQGAMARKKTSHRSRRMCSFFIPHIFPFSDFFEASTRKKKSGSVPGSNIVWLAKFVLSSKRVRLRVANVEETISQIITDNYNILAIIFITRTELISPPC